MEGEGQGLKGELKKRRIGFWCVDGNAFGVGRCGKDGYGERCGG